MKDVVKDLLINFNIYEKKHDFMGYVLNKNEINYHHLIVPKRLGGLMTYENGCILMRNNHDYLHVIQRYDDEMFRLISLEMIIMKEKGYLDISNLKQIHSMLKEFERKHKGGMERSGKLIIKDEYIKERVKFD